MGSSVAYRTIVTFLSQETRRQDASGQAANSWKTVDAQQHLKEPVKLYALDLFINTF